MSLKKRFGIVMGWGDFELQNLSFSNKLWLGSVLAKPKSIKAIATDKKGKLTEVK